MLDLQPIRAVLFDMDGVLYRGNAALAGATDLLALLAQHGIVAACITNNASRTAAQFSAKLATMGISVPAERIITSSLATSHYLRARYPRGTTVFIVGQDGLREALLADGYFVEQQHAPTLVVQGADFALTYERLKWACLAIRAGARLIATNPDTTFPSEEGLLPGAGAVTALLEVATETKATVIGKPGPAMFEVALAQLGATPAEALVIGDRLDTDIAGATAAGIASLLVLTGVSTVAEAAAGPHRPTAICADLPSLIAQWEPLLARR